MAQPAQAMALETPRAGPPRLVRRYVALLSGLSGVLLAAGLLGSAVFWPRSPEGVLLGVALALLTCAAFLLERYALVLQWGPHRTTSSFDEPAVFLALLLLPPLALVPMIATSMALVQLAARRAAIKGAFNVSAYAAAAALAAGVAILAQRAGWSPLLAASVGLAAYSSASSLLVAALFADLEGKPLARIYRERFFPSMPIHVALGISLGVALAALWAYNPFATLLLLPLGAMAVSFVRLSERADREVVIHRRLAQMCAQLAGTRSLDVVVERVLDTCGDLFLPGRATLALTRPGAPPRSWSRDFEGGAAAGAPLEAPLEGKDGIVLGHIAIHPGRRLRDARSAVDPHLVRIVAAQVAAALENAWALDEIAAKEDEQAGMIENVPACVARLDPEGHATLLNAPLRALLGPDAQAKRFADAAVFGPASTLREALEGLSQRRAFDDVEWRHAGRVYLASGAPIGKDGTSAVLLLDVTGRREAEEAVHAQSVTRPIVRRIILTLVGSFNASRAAITQTGRSLAREVEGSSAEDFTGAFRTMGLGTLRYREREAGGYRFEGEDLLERRPSSLQPTCHLAVGFLEGSVAKMHGSDALGSEVHCQSQGFPRCVFIVLPKKSAPERP